MAEPPMVMADRRMGVGEGEGERGKPPCKFGFSSSPGNCLTFTVVKKLCIFSFYPSSIKKGMSLFI